MNEKPCTPFDLPTFALKEARDVYATSGRVLKHNLVLVIEELKRVVEKYGVNRPGFRGGADLRRDHGIHGKAEAAQVR